MPYAQNHYPFENKEATLKEHSLLISLPKGLDQTRGWFYTLTVLSAALFDQPAFKNVIVNGIILAEDGAKMSKRLKNYPEPETVINQYGADAIRLYLLSSNAVIADDMRFSERGVEQIMRQVLIPLWNSYVFLATYAGIYAWKPSSSPSFAPIADIDRWILSLTMKLQREIEEGMEAYQLNRAVEPLIRFIDQLTNWYIRRCRSRFWSEYDTQDRKEAFQTLYEVLFRLIQLAAPYVPFLTEAIYQEMRTEDMPSSVHLLDYPSFHQKWRDENLEQEMALIQTVVSCGHGLRKEHKLKVRQPLRGVHLVALDKEILGVLGKQKHLIADELNVKEVLLHEKEEDFVQLKGKANFRVLGKKVGGRMNEAKQLIEQMDRQSLQVFLNGQNMEVSLGGEPFVLTAEDVVVEREVLRGLVAATAGEITIALDTSLDEALLLEGLARELVNKVNTFRRDQGFAVTDRILIELEPTARLKTSVQLHKDYICNETLASSLSFVETCEGEQIDLNGETTILKIIRVD